MKKLIFGAMLLLISVAAFAQTAVRLNLHPVVVNQPFSLNTVYTAHSGEAFDINSLRYYISGIQLIHDGGQTLVLSNTWLLVNADSVSYDLGMQPVTNVESINFYVGVGPDVNHLDPNTYPQGHPLAPQNPTMHWGWNAGYRFEAFNGRTDADANNSPEKVWEIHSVGDQLLYFVEVPATGMLNGQVIEIDVDYDIDAWLRDIDLSATGVTHGSFDDAAILARNVDDYQVFRPQGMVAVDAPRPDAYSLQFNYIEMNRPVVHYRAEDRQTVDLQVMDISGKLVFEAQGLPANGKVRITRPLSAGLYICRMLADGETVFSKKFQVYR